MLRSLTLEVLLEDVDDVVGFDALLSLVGELLHRLGVLWLFDLSLDLFLDDILICEVDTSGPATFCMGLDLVVDADPIRVHLKSM